MIHIVNRILAFFLGAIVVIFLILMMGLTYWLSNPTSDFLRAQPPVYINMGGEWYREMNRSVLDFPSVRARWTEEIFVAETGLECSDSGVSSYQNYAGDYTTHPVTTKVSDSLAECLEQEGTKWVTIRHRVSWGPIYFPRKEIGPVEVAARDSDRVYEN